MRLRHSVAIASTTLLALAPITAVRADTGFSVSINAAQEVPSNGSLGTGSGTLIVNNAQTQVTYSITYSGLSANRTAQHIHAPAPPGLNAGVVVGLVGTGTTSGTIAGVALISATNVGHMVAGNAYVNIHTTAFPGGEIRGQIALNPTPARPTTWGRIKHLYH